MSAVVGRLLLAVGIGVITAVVHNFFKNRREAHAHHYEGRRRSRRSGNGREYRPSNAWRDDNDDDDLKDKPVIAQNQKQEDKKPTERHNAPECHICFEAFEDLTSKGKAIMSAPCGHVFCRECLTRAFMNSKLCPRCRVFVPQGIDDCRPIYL